MKITIEASDLTRELSAHARLAGGTLEVLRHTRIVATEDGVDLTTTNLEETLTTPLDAEVEVPGEVLLEPSTLKQAVARIGAERVKISVGDAYWATITAGGDRARLRGLNSEDFPETKEWGDLYSASVAADSLMLAFERVLASVSKDEGRANLCGALIESDGETISIASTDGHRLSKVELGVQIPEIRCIVSGGAIRSLLGMMTPGEPVHIATRDGCFVARQAGFKLVSRLIEGVFPDYQKVLPEPSDTTAVVQVEGLLDALSFMQIFAGPKTNSVKLTLERNALQLYSSSQETGEASKTLAVEYDGPQAKAGYNVAYLKDALKATKSDVVELDIIDTLSPTTLRVPGEPENCWVVMPMRL